MAIDTLTNSPDVFTDMPPEAVIFGRSPVMRELREKLDRIASANVAVLIQGESGCGKDLLARLIHKYSPWAPGPYVKVNCPAIPGTLLESELFGYEKGAFTGAYGTKPGKVELANRGTLFLDEISEMNFDLQSKLLQLLQDGQFCRIGAQEDRRVEVRVVCATNRDLKQEVEHGRFRQDLFYRIAVVTVEVPPLRYRRDDILEIAEWLKQRYSVRYELPDHPFTPQMQERMVHYSWPGNIRELENFVRRYLILGSPEMVLRELEAKKGEPAIDDMIEEGDVLLKDVTKRAVAYIERRLILKVLEVHNGNRKKTARALGISYRALLYKIQQAGLPAARARYTLRNRTVTTAPNGSNGLPHEEAV